MRQPFRLRSSSQPTFVVFWNLASWRNLSISQHIPWKNRSLAIVEPLLLIPWSTRAEDRKTSQNETQRPWGWRLWRADDGAVQYTSTQSQTPFQYKQKWESNNMRITDSLTSWFLHQFTKSKRNKLRKEQTIKMENFVLSQHFWHQTCGFSIPTTNSPTLQTSSGCPKIQLSSDTIYLELALDPTD